MFKIFATKAGLSSQAYRNSFDVHYIKENLLILSIDKHKQERPETA